MARHKANAANLLACHARVWLGLALPAPPQSREVHTSLGAHFTRRLGTGPTTKLVQRLSATGDTLQSSVKMMNNTI